MTMKIGVRSSYIRKIILLLYLLLGVVWFFLNYFYLEPSVPRYDIININENVQFQLNNEEKEVVTLQKHTFPLVGKEDQITVMAKLPDEEISNPVILLDLYHATLDVYINGDLIFEYGHDLYEKNEVLGHGFFRIPLPKNYTGKELKIVATFTEDNCYTLFPNISLMNFNDSYVNTISANLLTCLVSMTLILIGIIGLIVTLTKKEQHDEIRRLTYTCLFAIFMSIWMLCNDNLIYLFVFNFQLASVLEYYSLYLAPIPVLFYFGSIQSGRKSKRLLEGLGYLFIAVNLISIVLNQLNIFHYIGMLPIIHVLITISVLCIVFLSFRSFRYKKKAEKILIYGMIFLGILILVDVLRFNIFKYINSSFHLNNSLLPIGTLIFILSMTYSYCITLLQSYSGKAERQILENLAYTDVLTGIYNRTKCEAIMKQVEENEEFAYIINFDLDNLKFINDNFGHYCGDSMIKSFSSALQTAFQGFHNIGRMGGDEFIVIAITKQEAEIIQLLRKLSFFVQDYNERSNEPYKLSYSYGYAAFDPAKKESIWCTYELSDAKMYEYKKKQKENSDILVLKNDK